MTLTTITEQKEIYSRLLITIPNGQFATCGRTFRFPWVLAGASAFCQVLLRPPHSQTSRQRWSNGVSPRSLDPEQSESLRALILPWLAHPRDRYSVIDPWEVGLICHIFDISTPRCQAILYRV